jgi:two-component system, chemotaxis family, CheB/CheR fusion protein
MTQKKESATTAVKTDFCPVVAVGASAGGLEAFTELLHFLPNNTGMAFVLIQHLDPKHHSMLAEILSKATSMPVVEAKNGTRVEPDHIYVIPPNVRMEIAERRLQLTPRAEDQGQHTPIDFFMHSLAESRNSQAIGVVLSGTASDGTRGLAAIKAGGGITFAQDEKSAKYDGMPRSAIASGCVDFILPPGKIARELSRISGHPYLKHDRPAAVEKPTTPGEGGYEKIFGLLRRTGGIDFRQYKPGTIQRRTLRRMALHKIEELNDYAKYLQEHPEEVEHLYQDLLIPVTSFFRDLEAFEVLKSKVFPAILKDKSNKGNIRIWAPGCSTGEETYSLAITLLEFLGEKASSFQVQVFGTDVNERGIEKARAGIYGERIAEEVSRERLRRFFTKVEEGYRVSKEVRDLCVFAKQNLAEDPPFSQMNLVACRNLMIYLGPALQRKIAPILHYALKPSGFLILGSSESVAAFPTLFAPVAKKHKIFSKKATATRLHYDFSATRYPREVATAPRARDGTESGVGGFDHRQDADRIVLKKYAPAGVVIDRNAEILQFRGHTEPYLGPAPGTASLNLLTMARGGLAVELRAAIALAKKRRATARRSDVEFRYHAQLRSVTISVEPLGAGTSGEDRQYLVLFENPSQAPALTKEMRASRATTRSGRTNHEGVELRRKLAATEEHLRAVIESKEASDEEFQSANEEILSANEELQSTNEELETSQEELQSANEELNTVNDELHNRNLELGQLTNDLDNLMTSTSLPVVMLDRGLRIRRLTTAAAKVLKVIPSDIGRPISDIRSDISVQNLEQLIAQVVDTLVPKELEVQDKEDHWYSLQIRPYRTSDDKIDGAVVMLADIDFLKNANERFKKAKEFAEGIIETVREPLLVLDSDLRVLYANSSFLQIFQVSRAETERKFLYRLGDEQWNIPKLRALLEEITSKGAPVRDFEVEHDFSGLGIRTMLLNARKMEDAHSDEPLVLLAIEDVTERKEAHDELELKVKQRTATLQSLTGRMLQLQDDERRKMARELHDSLGQYLASLTMNLGMLDRPEPPRPRTELLSESLELVQRCLAETRTLSYLLHPPMLDEAGFASAARWYVEGFAKRSGIQVDVHIPQDLKRLGELVETSLFRILQESLTNIHRHAQSSTVDFRLEVDGDEVAMSVSDHGRGIPAGLLERFNATGIGMGVGLSGIRDRVSELGGKLEIRSDTNGTLVRVTVPVASSASASTSRAGSSA